MCWDDDRGLAVGRQTADAVLRHQTSQSRISLSCLLCLSLFCHTHTHTHTPPHMHRQTQQRTFPLILLPKFKDLEGLTRTCASEHTHTNIYSSTKKSWIKFRHLLLKPTLWDVSTSFRCDLRIIQNIFPHRTDSSQASWSYLQLQIDTQYKHTVSIHCIKYTFITEYKIDGAFSTHGWQIKRKLWINK